MVSVIWLMIAVMIAGGLLSAAVEVAGRRKRFPTAATPPIPPAVRAELDQTPAWWDRQFHALLAETGAPRIDQSWSHAMETRITALLTREGIEEQRSGEQDAEGDGDGEGGENPEPAP